MRAARRRARRRATARPTSRASRRTSSCTAPLIRIVTVLAPGSCPRRTPRGRVLQWLVEFISACEPRRVHARARHHDRRGCARLRRGAIPATTGPTSAARASEGGCWVVELAVARSRTWRCVVRHDAAPRSTRASQQLAPVELPSTDLSSTADRDGLERRGARSASKGGLRDARPRPAGAAVVASVAAAASARPGRPAPAARSTPPSTRCRQRRARAPQRGRARHRVRGFATPPPRLARSARTSRRTGRRGRLCRRATARSLHADERGEGGARRGGGGRGEGEAAAPSSSPSPHAESTSQCARGGRPKRGRRAPRVAMARERARARRRRGRLRGLGSDGHPA